MIRRFSYDMELLYNKWSPLVISSVLIIHHILQYLLPVDLTWIQYVFLPSLITSYHMYNSRDVFGLCRIHRCLTNYSICNIFAYITEYYWIVPYMNTPWLLFIMAGTLVALGFSVYYYYVDIYCKRAEAKS